MNFCHWKTEQFNESKIFLTMENESETQAFTRRRLHSEYAPFSVKP